MITLIRLRCVYGMSGSSCTREVWERIYAESLPASESLTFKTGMLPARLIASSTDLPFNTIRHTYRFQAPNRASAEVIGEQLRSLGFSKVSS